MNGQNNGGYSNGTQTPANGNPPQCQTSQPTPAPQPEPTKEQQ